MIPASIIVARDLLTASLQAAAPLQKASSLTVAALQSAGADLVGSIDTLLEGQSLNNASMNVSGAPRLGPITLAGAHPNSQTFESAGLSDGQVFEYQIIDVQNFEHGRGTYTDRAHGGPSMTRDVVIASSQGVTTINLSSSAYVTALAIIPSATSALDATDPAGFPADLVDALVNLTAATEDQSILCDMRGYIGRAMFNLAQARLSAR
jgi:hypothetical protein